MALALVTVTLVSLNFFVLWIHSWLDAEEIETMSRTGWRRASQLFETFIRFQCLLYKYFQFHVNQRISLHRYSVSVRVLSALTVLRLNELATRGQGLSGAFSVRVYSWRSCQGKKRGFPGRSQGCQLRVETLTPPPCPSLQLLGHYPKTCYRYWSVGLHLTTTS